MLGKLLKYDMKSCLKILPVLLLVTAGAYGVGSLARVLGIPQIQGAMVVVLALAAVASVLAVLILVVLRYYKGLFGSVGYLYQTLPVKPGTLILSKTITAYVGLIAGALLAIVGIWAAVNVSGAVTFRELFAMVEELLGKNWLPMAIYVIISGFITLLLLLGEIFFAITLAHTRPFIRNSVIMAIVIYLVVNTVVGFGEVLFMLVVPLGLQVSEAGVSWTNSGMLEMIANPSNWGTGSQVIENFTLGVGNWFCDLPAAIGLLLASRWLMAKKTSVK